MDVSVHADISTVSLNKTFASNSPVLMCCFQFEQFKQYFKQYYTTEVPQCIKKKKRKCSFPALQGITLKKKPHKKTPRTLHSL